MVADAAAACACAVDASIGPTDDGTLNVSGWPTAGAAPWLRGDPVNKSTQGWFSALPALVPSYVGNCRAIDKRTLMRIYKYRFGTFQTGL